jgi:hypothetical protein
MAFVISRFSYIEETDPKTKEQVTRRVFQGDIGSPYPTKEAAEKVIAPKLTMLNQFQFEAREIPTTPAMEKSWARKGISAK